MRRRRPRLRRRARRCGRSAFVAAILPSGAGAATLVPEHVEWLSAVTAARVAKIAVRPGAAVEPETVLGVLENAEVQLAALVAEPARQRPVVVVAFSEDGQARSQTTRRRARSASRRSR